MLALKAAPIVVLDEATAFADPENEVLIWLFEETGIRRINMGLFKKFETIIDGMKNYTIADIEAALKKAGFSEIKADHHKSKPWITVIARK